MGLCGGGVGDRRVAAGAAAIELGLVVAPRAEHERLAVRVGKLVVAGDVGDQLGGAGVGLERGGAGRRAGDEPPAVAAEVDRRPEGRVGEAARSRREREPDLPPQAPAASVAPDRLERDLAARSGRERNDPVGERTGHDVGERRRARAVAEAFVGRRGGDEERAGELAPGDAARREAAQAARARIATSASNPTGAVGASIARHDGESGVRRQPSAAPIHSDSDSAAAVRFMGGPRRSCRAGSGARGSRRPASSRAAKPPGRSARPRSGCRRCTGARRRSRPPACARPDRARRRAVREGRRASGSATRPSCRRGSPARDRCRRARRPGPALRPAAGRRSSADRGARWRHPPPAPHRRTTWPPLGRRRSTRRRRASAGGAGGTRAPGKRTAVRAAARAPGIRPGAAPLHGRRRQARAQPRARASAQA